MSAECRVAASSLLQVFSDVNNLMQKGSNAIPLLFELSGSLLTISCSTGCLYRCETTVSNKSGLQGTASVLYEKITDFLDSGEPVTLVFEQFGLELTSASVRLTLPLAYSTVSDTQVPEGVRFTPIENTLCLQNLVELMNLGLDRLYTVDHPIEINENYSYLRFPNVQVKTRTDGLHFRAAVATEHVKLMVKFDPKEIYCNNTDVLILKRAGATVQLPVKPISMETSFEKLLTLVANPINLQLQEYNQRLRAMTHLGKKLRCKVICMDAGICTETTTENITISVGAGAYGEIRKVFQVPLDLWVSLTKPFSKLRMELLYGEEIICLRNMSLIVLLRAVV